MDVEGQAGNDEGFKGDSKGSQDLIDHTKLHATLQHISSGIQNTAYGCLLVRATLQASFCKQLAAFTHSWQQVCRGHTIGSMLLDVMSVQEAGRKTGTVLTHRANDTDCVTKPLS